MKPAYALLGLAWLMIIVAGAYAFNHKFSKEENTEASIISSTSTPMTLTLRSSAFENNGTIPAAYTCDGERDMNPPLSLSGVPEGAKTLALIMDDPDVPKALHSDGVFDHWVLFNIPRETKEIASGVTLGTAGANGAGKNTYIGPCPPREYEPSEHRYFFKLYALDIELPLKGGASKADIEKAIAGHVLEETNLVGRYKRR